MVAARVVISGKRKHPLIPSYRFVVLLLMFFGCMIRQAGNNVMNFTIACMVNASSYLDNDGCAALADSNKDLNEFGGTYHWSREIQSNILAGLAWGGVAVIFLGGYVCDRFGVKKLYVGVMALLGVTCCLIPVVAPYGWGGIFAIRIIQGSAMVVGWPVILVVANEWFAASEHSLVHSLSASGNQFGAVVAMLISGKLCETVGWQASFYLLGGAGILVSLAWLVFYSDNARNCSFVSQEESDYLVLCRKQGRTKQTGKVIPWRAILTSRAVWAIIVVNFGSCYTFFFIGQFSPTYYKEFLGVDPTSSGIYTAIPFLIQILGRTVAFYLIIGARTLRIPTDTFVRVMGIVMGLGQGCFIALATVFDCYTKLGAVFCFSMVYFSFGLNVATFIKSSAEIAPQYAGIITGISQTAMFSAGVVSPYLTGAITTHSTESEWRIAIFIAAAFSIIGSLFFAIFGSGNLQEWAVIKSDEPEQNYEKERKIYTILENDNEATDD